MCCTCVCLVDKIFQVKLGVQCVHLLQLIVLKITLFSVGSVREDSPTYCSLGEIVKLKLFCIHNKQNIFH